MQVIIMMQDLEKATYKPIATTKANFVSYISAKYYLNGFSFHMIIMKVIGVNFFETQCINYIDF